MPTYTYHCKKCDSSFELFHSISDDSRKKCSVCGSVRTEKMISGGVGLIFKGSGFYLTDHKGKNPSLTPANGHDSHESADTTAEKTAEAVKQNGSGSNGTGSNGTAKKAEKTEKKSGS